MSYWQNIHKHLNKDFSDNGNNENEMQLDSNLSTSSSPSRFSNEHAEPSSSPELEKIKPIGNYIIKESTKKRKLSVLFGFDDNVPERSEILEDVQIVEDKPETEIETWERSRKTLQDFSERDRRVAFKRDELAEYDEDGYRYTPEQPTHRDGFNNTLRLRPPQNPDLHNGKILNIQGKAENFQEKQMKLNPSRRLLSTKKIEVLSPDFAKPEQETQLYVPPTKEGSLKENKKVEILSPNFAKPDQQTQMYVPPSKRSLRKTLLKRESIQHTLGKYFMKALCETDTGIQPEQRKIILHSFLKQGDVLLEELGKAVIELGFVLPPEIREASKRTEYDQKAMDIGQKIFLQLYEKGETPIVEKSLKQDLALALGRTFENLKSLASVSTGRNRILTPEIEKTTRKNQTELGNITLQILENASSRIQQKGRVSEFRKEQINKEQRRAESTLEVESPNRNGQKSIWDGFYKDDYVNDRSLLPHRRDDL